MATLGLQLRLTGFASLDVLVTLVWFVAITNALNLLDNMDGLAAGVAAITVGFRLAFFLADGNLEGATLAAITLGALLGFLVFNFNPASIFMGDAGSLFLGVIVSGLSLVGGWPYSRGVVSVLLFPVLILLVPIFDTQLVTVTRTFAGRSIAEGGRDHTSHRLALQQPWLNRIYEGQLPFNHSRDLPARIPSKKFSFHDSAVADWDSWKKGRADDARPPVLASSGQ